jgi:hypothetical protein
MLTRAMATLCILLLGTSGVQQTGNDFLRDVPGGFMNTGEYGDLQAAEQNSYAMGFVNGMMVAGILGADFKKVEALNRCTSGMKSKQVAAILDKYVKDHPESWHQTLAAHSFAAIVEACPDLKKQLAQHATQSP